MAIGRETDRWPYVPAKWRTELTVKPRRVRLVVMHCMEAPEKPNTAENVGLFFKRGESRSSAHIGVDSDSTVQYVKDNDVAWAAPGVNNDGIHIEMAGMSAQSLREWTDQYSTLMIERAANAAAQYCVKYDLPPLHLTNEQLKAGKKGIIGHYQATAMYKPNNGHTDPGKNFPWAFFMARVTFYYQKYVA